jgi:IMP dehydrogenase
MMTMTIKEALTFDDVLLIPQYSEILPSDVKVTTKLTPTLDLQIPILSAAMDTVTEDLMAIALAKAGGIGIIHKNMSPQHQATLVQKVKEADCQVGAAIGIGDDAHLRANLLIAAGVDVLIIDTAHGHSRLVIDSVKSLKQSFPNCPVIAGNIATGKAAQALAEAGVDAVKVGIGPGSICITRIVAGIGMPQLTAIQDVALALSGSPVKIIADGGIKHSGDITKALAAGAHCVMLGGLLAGCEESPGDIILIDDKKYKSYRGMGSIGALTNGSMDRYFQHKSQGKPITEGVEGTVPYKGPVAEILHQLVGGLRLGMGYLGAATIPALQGQAEFVKITPAGSKESHIHNMAFVKDTPNYQRVK